MVVSCAVMLTCETSESVPVFTLQRSTPQPEAVIASSSSSSPGMTPCAQAVRESANATDVVIRWIRMAAQSAPMDRVHNEYDKVRRAPTLGHVGDFASGADRLSLKCERVRQSPILRLTHSSTHFLETRVGSIRVGVLPSDAGRGLSVLVVSDDTLSQTTFWHDGRFREIADDDSVLGAPLPGRTLAGRARAGRAQERRRGEVHAQRAAREHRGNRAKLRGGIPLPHALLRRPRDPERQGLRGELDLGRLGGRRSRRFLRHGHQQHVPGLAQRILHQHHHHCAQHRLQRAAGIARHQPIHRPRRLRGHVHHHAVGDERGRHLPRRRSLGRHLPHRQADPGRARSADQERCAPRRRRERALHDVFSAEVLHHRLGRIWILRRWRFLRLPRHRDRHGVGPRVLLRRPARPRQGLELRHGLRHHLRERRHRLLLRQPHLDQRPRTV